MCANEDNEYIDCFVAFLDILGFKEMLDKSEDVHKIRKILDDVTNLEKSSFSESSAESCKNRSV